VKAWSTADLVAPRAENVELNKMAGKRKKGREEKAIKGALLIESGAELKEKHLKDEGPRKMNNSPQKRKNWRNVVRRNLSITRWHIGSTWLRSPLPNTTKFGGRRLTALRNPTPQHTQQTHPTPPPHDQHNNTTPPPPPPTPPPTPQTTPTPPAPPLHHADHPKKNAPKHPRPRTPPPPRKPQQPPPPQLE